MIMNFIRIIRESRVNSAFVAECNDTYTTNQFINDILHTLDTYKGDIDPKLIRKALVDKLPIEMIPSLMIANTLGEDSKRIDVVIKPNGFRVNSYSVETTFTPLKMKMKWSKDGMLFEKYRKVSIYDCGLILQDDPTTLWINFRCETVNDARERISIPLTRQEGYYVIKKNGDRVFIRTAGAFKGGALTAEELHRVYDIVADELKSRQPDWIPYSYEDFNSSMLSTDIVRICE